MDLLIIGKAAVLSAAKRYICGKIDKKEFDKLCQTIIPQEIIEEKNKISEDYHKQLTEIKSFIES